MHTKRLNQLLTFNDSFMLNKQYIYLNEYKKPKKFKRIHIINI